MCGIAGFIGEKRLDQGQIKRTLSSLNLRGPDVQNKKVFSFKKKKNIKAIFFHSRLSIIDLNKRSNQPFQKHNLTISFNGEIYNYNELRRELIIKGYKFRTKSDTEVILSGYKEYKESFFKKMRGMWALAIMDQNKEELILSRDRFGEKPLYYFMDKKNLYFGSQINQIHMLSEKKFEVNEKQILNYLCLGYRSIDKYGYEFFKKIKKLEPGSILRYNLIKIKKKKFWNLNYRPNFNISRLNAIKQTRDKVIKAVTRNVVSDVPISVLLSGGIDSNIIIAVINKILKKKVSTFSIIDNDQKYNEIKLINRAAKHNKVKNYKIFLKKKKMKRFIQDIEKYIDYNSKPLFTTTSYVSSKLHEKIYEQSIKVSLTGIGADELFAGYYDHGLHFLQGLKKKSPFKKELESWKKNILSHVRNPHFINFKKFLKSTYYTKYILFTNENLKKMIKIKQYSRFKDKKFCKDNLRNRMLNELFYETIPPILNEDDQNHMKSSVENRSPFLDADLVEYAYNIPSIHLIKNAQNKYILREAFKDILPKKIYSNKIKKGFNVSIDSLVQRNEKSFKDTFSDKNKKIYKFVRYEKLKDLFSKKKLNNSEQMFLFRFINCSIFLERFA